MGIASTVFLAGYFAFALYAGVSPSNDPQRGMAQGFIILVMLVPLSVGGALWFAVVRNHPWLLRTIFVFTAFPALA
jgi:high-affinity Fe2+/Pb2+ permease